MRYQDPVKFYKGDATKGIVDKCNLCMDRIEQGLIPACVDTCPGKARLAGDIFDQDSEISKALSASDTGVLLPGKGTEPFCFYIGLEG